VKFSTQGLDRFTNNWQSTLHALRGPPFGAFRLTIQAPGIAVFLNVAHAFLERITTLSTEEMTKVPVFTKRNSMLTQDWGFAVFAFGGIDFVPVKMTKVAKSSITILSHRLTFNLW
jgi:hypothetical protein